MTPDPTPFPLDRLSLRGIPDAPALVADGRTLTYADLDDEVATTAAALLAHGLSAGDRVASWMGKTALACILPLAAARAGLVHVPINPVLRRAQAEHILADSGARLLIANRARLDTIATDAKTIALDDWQPGSDRLGPSTHDPDELVALLYTSGSTGRPKGVMLSHANLWLGAISVAHYLKLNPADRTLCLLPLAFDYGQNQLLAAWASGGTAIAFDYLLPRDVVRAVGRHDVTLLAGVPSLWHQLADQAWDGEGASLTTLTNSGGHLPEPLVRRLRGLFPEARLHLMYGLTEAFRSASLDPGQVDAHPDSVGSAIPFAELRIVRPDGTNAAPGEEGELVHSGPLVAQGYWNDPARTAERFRNEDVWSGDTMVFGDDGLLRFRGRDDAMIKTNGNRVSPTEIEEAALASGAMVEAAVFGLADDKLGQAIVLVGVARGDDHEERLRAHFAAELPAFMRPVRIVLIPQMPLGPNGKLDRAALRMLLEDDGLDGEKPR
ncbi:MAG: AMP-binding protein [Sphingomonas bacterium]|nr:AMP-binding protein [Sphingomonas bacterium]